MEKETFKALIGKDVVVEFQFFNELQLWSMKNFYVDEKGEIHHNRLPLNMDAFIPKCRNPHKGEATHG